MPKYKKSAPRKAPNPQRAALVRKIAIHSTIGCLFAGTLVGGFYFVQDYVERQIAIPTSPPGIVIKNRPHWMSDFLVQRIADSARPADIRSAFDREMLTEMRHNLEQNPWIEKVHNVRRAFGQQAGDLIEINCDYRVPVALVKWKDYYYLVDRTGYKLPEQYEAKDVPQIVRIEDGQVDIRIIDGVKHAPPVSGHKWVGDDLAAGLEMIGVLSDKPYAQEILKINVARLNGEDREPAIVLVTKYATEIRWGRVPSAKDAFVEVPAARKLDRLREFYERYGRVDAGKAHGMDIRFDTITYVEPASANASIDPKR